MITKQIKNYTENNKFTYSGIKGTLYYLYKIKRVPIKTFGKNLRLVQYSYSEREKYFNDIYNLQQKRKNNSIQPLLDTQTIEITSPHTKPLVKKKIFTILDKKEEN